MLIKSCRSAVADYKIKKKLGSPCFFVYDIEANCVFFWGFKVESSDRAIVLNRYIRDIGHVSVNMLLDAVNDAINERKNQL